MSFINLSLGRRFGFVLPLVFSGFAWAKTDPQCLNRNQVPAMERLFSIDHGIHRYQHCELTNLSYLTVKAVHVLKTVSDGQFNGSHSFGPSLLVGSPLDFARARTSRISLAGERDAGCGGGAVAYYSASSSTIVICPFAAKFEDAHLLAETIVHEARHADGHAHVRCARGSLTQTFGNACDERLSDLGSYAVSLQPCAMGDLL